MTFNWEVTIANVKKVVWWICRNGRQDFRLVNAWPLRKLVRERNFLISVCKDESGIENLE